MVKEFVGTLNGCGALGALSKSASDKIKKNSSAIAQVLRKAKRLNGLAGLGDTASKSDVVTVQESIELLNKDNGLMNDDEIRAWVYYKRTLGVPMTGWEKYFCKGKGNNDKLLVTTKATKIDDQNGVFLKTVPKNTTLGALSPLKESDSVYSFIDKTGNTCIVAKDKVKVVDNPYKADQSEVDKMVKDGVLFYNNGNYLPYAVYVFANSYDRLLELEQDKDFILKKYGQRVFDAHKAAIDNNKPKQLSFLDPIKDNRPYISPLSEFASRFCVTELAETAPMEINSYEESLHVLYGRFLWRSLPKETFLYSNITGPDIVNVCFDKKKKPRGYDDKAWELYVGRCYSELDRVFVIFIDTCLTVADRQRLDMQWNREFNGYPAIPSNKVPIALPMSRVVRGGTFELRPAQREGVAFIELAQSGCVAFDVGVGKTFTAIAEVMCAMQQGRCKRPLIAVPNSTYQNWITEIIGKGSVKGLLAGCGITINNWFNLGADITAKESDIKDNSITLVTKEGFVRLGFTEDLEDDLAKELKEDLLPASDRDGASGGKADAKTLERIQNILGRGNKGSRLDFDKCGFDYVVIDEAHNYRNIFSKVQADTSKKTRSYKTVTLGKPSDIGLSAFIFCNYVQRKFGGNVMLLTATPFSNAPMEVFSMLSLVAQDDLHRRHLNNVHRFFETFVNETYDEVVGADLNIKNAWTVHSFKNRVVLQNLLYSKFDYKTGDEANVKRPNKINIPLLYQQGKMLDKNHQILSYLKMTDRQAKNQQIINAVINNSGMGKGASNVLSGMGSSLNNALSPFLFKLPSNDSDLRSLLSKLGVSAEEIYLINSDPEDAEEFINESPKIRFACECIKSVKDWHESRGEVCSGQIIYADRGKEYFELIKEYLEDTCGFKQDVEYQIEDEDDKNGKIIKKKVDEVSILDGGTNPNKKNLIMKAFNDGVIKVIIGTSTIKEGVNLQKRSTVLYNLYPNWNPTDVQQLEGRLYRQGNTFQFVRIVMPLMQDSMDTFVFQKLQEKTDRINDIWYKADRGNVLNVDALDPKEVKFALITDIDQLVKIQIKKDVEEIDRDLYILNDEKDGLRSFTYLRDRLNSYRTSLLDDMRRGLDNMGRFVPILNPRPTADELKKMPADERKKAESVIERYDELMKFIHQTSFDDDKEIIAMSRRLSNLYPNYSGSYAGTFAEIVKQVAKIEAGVLEKRGFNRNSDLQPIINAIDYDIKNKEADKEYRKSQDYYQELYDGIVKKKKEMNIVGKSIESRIDEFEHTNYVMQYAFDPTLELPNNYLPNPNEKKLTAKPKSAPVVEPQTDEDDDELEMLELEAEALALELELGSDSISGIDDMEFYFDESEDVAIVEGVSEEDHDEALAFAKKELDARLGKNRYRLWSDWHIGDKWNFIVKRK